MTEKADENESVADDERSRRSDQDEKTTMTDTDETRPTQTPPQSEAATTEEEQSRPTQSPPDSAASTAEEDEPAQPTELPPSEQAENDDDAYGAATWHNNRKITALWSIDQNRNSWIHVDGLGWRRLADNSDSAVVALTTLSTHAKQTAATVNLLEDSGKITEIYVWS
jgi:hypothetical protein